MLNLVLKDLLLQKKTFLFTMGYAIFLFFCFKNPALSNIVYITVTVMTSYLFIIYATSFDDKNKCDIMLNSLPVTRKEIVTARYLFLLITIFIGIATSFIIGAFFKIIGDVSGLWTIRLINHNDLIISLFSVSLMGSIYMPFYYKFGNIYVRIFNVVFFIVVFSVPKLVTEYIIKNRNIKWIKKIILFANTIPDWVIPIIIVVFSLLILSISLLFSIRIYGNKDF